MTSVRKVALVGAFAICAPALAVAQEVTIPKGTSVDLIMQEALSTRTAKVGDSFRATVVPAIDIDDRPFLPDGTAVVGEVALVRSVLRGHPTGVIGVKFTRIRFPDGREQDIDGVLTSLRQNDRKLLVDLAPKVSTGRNIDTVFIGRSTAPDRASTLVGDDLAEHYSDSGLGAPDATVTAGTRITMELAEALTGPPAAERTADSKARRIYVAHASVAAAQQALKERHYYDGEIDGQLGWVSGATRLAVIRFQLDNDQVPTGDLDEEVLSLLGVELPARTP